VTADLTYEFLVIILPIQCASSNTLSCFLKVVYRREFLCRTRVLVISTPRWGHFRSHQGNGEWMYEFLVVILPIQCASSSTLSRFLRVVYRGGTPCTRDFARKFSKDLLIKKPFFVKNLKSIFFKLCQPVQDHICSSLTKFEPNRSSHFL
jgi:hypothetical protein